MHLFHDGHQVSTAALVCKVGGCAGRGRETETTLVNTEGWQSLCLSISSPRPQGKPPGDRLWTMMAKVIRPRCFGRWGLSDPSSLRFNFQLLGGGGGPVSDVEMPTVLTP